MSHRSFLLCAILPAWLISIAFAGRASADPIEMIASDEHGVTLRLTVPAWRLELSDPDGNSAFRIDGLRTLSEPGRPELPFASALLAVPPGAAVTARVLDDDAEEMRDGVHLVVGDRSAFHDDRNGLGPVPAREPVEPIIDGIWPNASTLLGKPFVLRGQRMVAVSLMPFRFDSRERRLYSRRTLTVRVEFRGGTTGSALAQAPADRHWEPVLQASLLNYPQGRAWRVARTATPLSRSLFGGPRGAGGGPFDENFPEVRVRMDTTGVYAIPFSQLIQTDPSFPSLPIAQVSVHRHEFIEGATPPYVTAELPIEVDDANTNGTFDAGDRIVVFVQDWAHRSGVSLAQRNWGDAEVVYATYVSGTGLRLRQRAGWRNLPGLTPLSSYPWTQRWERNFTYSTTPPDTLADTFHWTEGIQLYYDRPDSFRFEANHLDVTHNARVDVTWQGRASTPHFNWAFVRNQAQLTTIVVDSLVWFGLNSNTGGSTIPGTALSEGLTNRLAIWGKSDPGPPNSNSSVSTALNYFDVTYWRSYRALNGYLPCNSGTAAGEYQIRGVGFPGSDVRVYDVTNPSDPARLTLDPSHILAGPGSTWEVEFQDSVATAAVQQYFVFSTPRVPASDHFGAVTRQNLTNHVAGDYLLIVPEAFQSAVAPLAALRSQNMTVNVSLVEAVFDEFNGGRRSSYAIKRYVRYALDHWNVRFVLLVGDGKEDPQDFFGSEERDWIPVHKIAGPVGVAGPGGTFEIVASDPWYGCFEGPETGCDALYNANGLPVIPEVYVGRLPVNSLQQATDVITKLVAYENVTPDQTWRNEVMLHSDDAYSTLSTFGQGGGDDSYCRRSYEHRFRQLNETIENVIHNEAGLANTVIDPFVMTFLLAGEPTTCCVPDTCRPDMAATQTRTRFYTLQLLDHLKQGRLWWNYQGHANPYVLSHESIFRNDLGVHDWPALQNFGKPFLFSAFSCHVNTFASTRENFFGASLGEQLVNLPSAGAIGVWASSGFEIIPRNGTDHINVTWSRAMFSEPPRDEFLGESGARVVLGETIATALLRHLAPTPGGSQPPPDYNERGVGLTYNLLGDPATRLSIGSAQALVTANGIPVTSGVPVRLHTPGDTLRIDAEIVSNVRIDVLELERTNAAGTAVIPPADYTVTPAFPDTSFASGGGRHYHLTYRTTLLPETYRYTIKTVDRNGVPGSFDVAFQFLTVLRQAGGGAVGEDDLVSPTAVLELLVISPKPLVPQTDLTLTVNGTGQPFTEAPAPGDASGREWILSWTHADYAPGAYEVALSAVGGGTERHHFIVTGGELQIRNPFAFPNPFEDDLGTFFSMLLVSGNDVDVDIRVFTLSGKLVYQWEGRGLSPGYHQIPWPGRDAEGAKLANGVYPYRILAKNGSSSATYEGRLVKLRKPRRNDTANP